MCLLVLGLIPFVHTILENRKNLIAHWSTTLGFLGYAVFAVANARSINGEYDFAHVFSRLSNNEILLSIAAGKTIELERLGIITFGCVGIWILISSFRGMKMAVFSKPLGYVGIGFALMNFLIIGDFWPYLGVGRPAQIAIGLGGAILGPIWFMGIGNYMKMRSRNS